MKACVKLKLRLMGCSSSAHPQLFVDSLVASFGRRAVRHVFVVYQQCVVWSGAGTQHNI